MRFRPVADRLFRMRKRLPVADSSKVDPLTRLWILRLLSVPGVCRSAYDCGELDSDDLAAVLSGNDPATPSLQDWDLQKVNHSLRVWRRTAERNADSLELMQPLRSNIERLSALVGLDSAESSLLAFALRMHTDPFLLRVTECVDERGAQSSIQVLAMVLGLQHHEAKRALSSGGRLYRSSLLMFNRHRHLNLFDRLDLPSESTAEVMHDALDDVTAVLRNRIHRCGDARLSFNDYAHVEKDLEILRPYLRHAVADRRSGVNVFLYGSPGTGKSQLARLLADDSGCELLEISSGNEESPLDGKQRMQALSGAQILLAKSNALLLLDEAEDIFPRASWIFSSEKSAISSKAFMNRMLDENPRPVIWASNSHHGVDPAYMRRFDFVMQLNVPPKSHRTRIIRSVGGELLHSDNVRRIADADAVAPAIVARAVSVARLVGTEACRPDSGAVVERIIENTLLGQGHHGLRRAGASDIGGEFDPQFTNASEDLLAIAAGAATHGVRLCLYGPPGTGKSAFGRWLAAQLERPVHALSMSDVLGPYVGESEQNVAKAFKDAEKERAVLVFDEIEGLLRGRESAIRRWEVTLVNELLLQMERFDGIFIATTNMMDNVDHAALRRFDFKVRFDYLAPAQLVGLFRHTCHTLGLGSPDTELCREVGSLGRLTPGDFAVVVRRNRFVAAQCPRQVYQALMQEVAAKDSSRARPIGFVAPSIAESVIEEPSNRRALSLGKRSERLSNA